MVQLEDYKQQYPLDRSYIHIQAERYEVKAGLDDVEVEVKKSSFPMIPCTENMMETEYEKSVFKLENIKKSFCMPSDPELYLMNTNLQLAEGKDYQIIKIQAYPCSSATRVEGDPPCKSSISSYVQGKYLSFYVFNNYPNFNI
jgi:hypothetical protein